MHQDQRVRSSYNWLHSHTEPSHGSSIYRRHLHLLECFHQPCLRSILDIHWSDFVTNTEVLEKTETTSIEAMLLKTLLRWAGYVPWMGDRRLHLVVLCGLLFSGYRNIRAPKKRYKDYAWKKSLRACHMHRPPPMVYSCCWPRGLETPSIRLFPPSKIAAGTILNTREGGRTMQSMHPTGPDLNLQPLRSALPVPYWTYQSTARRQTSNGQSHP